MFVYTTRVWLSFLVDATYRSGLNPLSKRRLHRLIFLSNCLAPLFEATPQSAQIVKYKHGPFYPLIQWELDRLATMGVLTISEVSYVKTEKGWWLNANYGVGEQMPRVLLHASETEYARRIGVYLNEVVAGFASLHSNVLDDVALRDENYARPGSSEDAFIDFSEKADNFSLKTALEFKHIVPKNIVPTRKEELFLYMRFLEAITGEKAA